MAERRQCHETVWKCKLNCFVKRGSELSLSNRDHWESLVSRVEVMTSSGRVRIGDFFVLLPSTPPSSLLT